MRPPRSLVFCSESADTYLSGGETKVPPFVPNGAAAIRNNGRGHFREGETSEGRVVFFLKKRLDLFRNCSGATWRPIFQEVTHTPLI